WLANLFPIVIDAGAVAGVVMAGLTSNPVFRRNGWALGALTLAASLVFNVTGHEITGKTMAGIPDGYAWTSTAAALLIPCLLAVFVHSAASALHQWSMQQRAAKQPAIQTAAPAAVSTPAPSTPVVKTTKPAKTKGGGNRPGKADAVEFARKHGITTGPELRDAMQRAGWNATQPTRQTWHNWASAAHS